MDAGLISLKIQQAIGRQIYLISTIFVVGIFAAIWLVNLAAKPVESLLAYAVTLARNHDDPDNKLLVRDDEAGQLARLFLYFSKVIDLDRARSAAPDADA